MIGRLPGSIAILLASTGLLVPVVMVQDSWLEDIKDGTTLAIPKLVLYVTLGFLAIVGQCFAFARISTIFRRYLVERDRVREIAQQRGSDVQDAP